jgi:NTP pyrophosphatase (non-canonical NTP hydrolase)
MKRGEIETLRFAQKMVETMNMPKNAAKGDWKERDWLELYVGLQNEVQELFSECAKENKSPEDYDRIVSEAADVACYALMLADKFRALE